MFDTTQPFVFRVPTSSGMQKVQVQFPTDDQWIEYNRKRKVIERQLGRGRSEQDVQGRDEAYAWLFSQIAVAPPAEFGAAEAGLIINKMLAVKVESVEDEGVTFVVRIRFWAGTSEHRLRMPTAAQLRDSERSTKVTSGQHGTIEYQPNPLFFAELYDKLVSVPPGHIPFPSSIIHKNAVTQAVLEHVRALMDGDENF